MTNDPSFEVDDLMALADAVGVTGPREVQPEGKLLLHPSLRAHLDNRLDEVLEAWSYAAAGVYPPDLPIDLVPADPAEADRVRPDDIDVCEYCDGDGDRQYVIDGEPVNRLCTWCGGTGERVVR